MSNIAVRASELGKLYLGGRRRSDTDLRETLTETLGGPFRKFFSADRSRVTTATNQLSNCRIWALRHASLEIKHGDVVGILGENGGGKTTLLRILSRITYPTEGYAEIHGRVGTLLDGGAGFHPELTGRENIYLKGSLLGMRGIDNARKFEEIVAFAELEKFIDTPLKCYSSGMCVRLAFAVAAHLDSEILLVDEVLAVADRHFQKKCLEKMVGIAQEKRTVLFVSHDLDYVLQLCGRGIVLAGGQLIYSGSASEAVNYYSSIANPELRKYSGIADLQKAT